MTTHVRQQIRERAKSLLIGLPTTGANAFVGRTWPTPDEVLPCLMIYTLDEPALEIAMGGMGMGARQMRSVALKIHGRHRLDDDEALLNALDAMALEVETVLLAAGAFAPLIHAIALTGSLTNTQATAERGRARSN